jgi:serine/threonine protein phosphatase PrpC
MFVFGLPKSAVLVRKIANIDVLKSTFVKCLFSSQIDITTSKFLTQGHRPKMEDQIIVGHGNKLVGVFDGHDGSQVAEILRDNFENILSEKLHEAAIPHTSEMISNGILSTFNVLNEQIANDTRFEKTGGSTAAVSYILPNNSNPPSIITANVGDSRVVLSRNGKAIDLTVDHKTDVPAERARIEAAGGYICAKGYVMNRLAITRSIGECSLDILYYIIVVLTNVLFYAYR